MFACLHDYPHSQLTHSSGLGELVLPRPFQLQQPRRKQSASSCDHTLGRQGEERGLAAFEGRLTTQLLAAGS